MKFPRPRQMRRCWQDQSCHALMQQTRDDHYLDGDMAVLVRSASKPGLGARLAAYVAALKKPSASA